MKHTVPQMDDTPSHQMSFSGSTVAISVNSGAIVGASEWGLAVMDSNHRFDPSEARYTCCIDDPLGFARSRTGVTAAPARRRSASSISRATEGSLAMAMTWHVPLSWETSARIPAALLALNTCPALPFRKAFACATGTRGRWYELIQSLKPAVFPVKRKQDRSNKATVCGASRSGVGTRATTVSTGVPGWLAQPDSRKTARADKTVRMTAR